MSTIFKAGLALGILVEIWTYLMGFTGWYKDPVLMNLFWVVIAIQIAVLMWALKRTAAEGRGYFRQLSAGITISMIGGVFVFLGSLLFTMVVFPSYFRDLAAVQEQMLRAAGHGDEEVRRMLELNAQASTPMVQATLGFLGTMVTGVLVSAILGATFRAKRTT